MLNLHAYIVVIFSEYPHKFLRGLPEAFSVVEDSRAVLEVQVEDPEVRENIYNFRIDLL